MTERRVFFHDVGFGNALGFQERAQNLVGRPRINVIGAEEDPALGGTAVFAHQVFDRRNRLLVRRSAGIEHIARTFLALVLDGVEQHAVQLFKHRQHGFAGYRRPAAEHDIDLVFLNQLARLLCEERPVRSGIDNHGFELLAQKTAFFVLLVYQHQHGVFQRGFADRHGAGKGMEDTDLNSVSRLRDCRCNCHPRC